jgi:hypothetical protein
MNLNTLIQVDLLNFRRDLLLCFKEHHPQLFAISEKMFSGQKNMLGLQVTEGGKVIEKYTLMMDGINVVEAKSGTLDSSLHLPLVGVVKPYVTIERSVIEKMIKDKRFMTEMFTVSAEYMPDFTIRFML